MIFSYCYSLYDIQTIEPIPNPYINLRNGSMSFVVIIMSNSSSSCQILMSLKYYADNHDMENVSTICHNIFCDLCAMLLYKDTLFML